MSTLQAPAKQSGPSAYLPQPARVLDARRLTGLELWLQIELESGRPLDHAPGQFVQVSIPGVGECPISICSSPTRPRTFELCVRRVGEVTERIHRLAPGEAIGIRGPLGRGFDVDELAGMDLLVVAGGLGLAPARSLIQYVLDRRDRFGRFDLLYGARSPAELLFVEDLAAWSGRDDVNLLVTVDRPDEKWAGHRGVVTTLFGHLKPPDPQRTAAIIIGPPVMFKFVILEVLARRIPQRSVYCSLERRMKCGIGKCGHCQVNNVYVCLEGPVFHYGQLKALPEAIQ